MSWDPWPKTVKDVVGLKTKARDYVPSGKILRLSVLKQTIGVWPTMKRRMLCVAVAILVLAGSSIAQNQKEISVLASILFKPALDKVIPGFESKTGNKVNFTWGTGRTARERIASGEIFDAVIV